MSKFVKIMSIPGSSMDVEVDDDASIQQIADQANMRLSQMNITCTDPATGANASTVPANGAQIVLTRQVKGA